MKIGLTQMDIVWENKAKNMVTVTKLLEQAQASGVELIVFPEMTLTGFTMNTSFAGEEMLFSETLQFFKDCSRKYEMAIAFGFVEDFGEEYYNKLMIVSKGRILYDYDKIHPFSYGEEGRHYIGGHEVKTVDIKEVAVSGFVCYDLRFPEIFQAVSDQSDLMVVIADWPASRRDHWLTLLKARAIENQAYVAGVNCVGDIDGLSYCGDSSVFDPLGQMIGTLYGQEGIVVCDIGEDAGPLRHKFQMKKDRRNDFYIQQYEKIRKVQSV